jgi:dipeptidyl aminopeptidase/acylaminoacyl peptidase
VTQKTRNLLVFGLAWFAILSLLTFGLYLPYVKAYDLVHPVRIASERPAYPDYQEVQFTTTDGLTLKGWYLPPRQEGLVIFVHGLGGNRAELLDEAEFIAQAGYGVLLFDLRNHGESEGSVTTLGLDEVRDVEAAVNFARRNAGWGIPLALFGHSMGGAAVLLAAVKIPEIRAVIAESAYTSVEDNISEGVHGLTGLPPFPFAPLIVFFGEREAGVEIRSVRPLEAVGQLSPRPLLLIHGELDSLIPAENSLRLYAAAREPKELYLLPHAGHGGFLQAAPEDYPRRILAFLEKYILAP